MSTETKDELDTILDRIVSQESGKEGGYAEYALNQEDIKYGNPLNYKEELKADIETLITKRTLEAKRDLLDSIIDLNGETFNKWTQNDIANFFHGVGKIYRDLEAELKRGLDTNHE